MKCNICKNIGILEEKIRHIGCYWEFGYQDEVGYESHDKCARDMYIWCDRCKHYTLLLLAGPTP